MSLSIWGRLTHRPAGQLALVFILGLLAGLAFAPLYLVPLWPLGFGVTLLFLFRARTKRMRLGLSFLFSYGYMMSGLYWIALAPTAVPEFYFLIPLALVLLPAVVASFGTLSLFLASFWRHDGLTFACSAMALWLFFEWRRGIDLTGFGWNRAGMIWTFDPLPIQIAAFGGVPILSLVTLMVGSGVFLFLTGQRRLAAAFALVPLIVVVGVGGARLALNPMTGQDVLPDTKVRLVQANIPKNSFNGAQIYKDHLDLSTSQSLEGISHVIWPEGSIRDFLDQNEGLRQHLATSLSPADYSLVFGRQRAADRVFASGSSTLSAHLSAYLVDHKNFEFTTYQKAHLVPFGEYVPYKNILARLGFSALTGQFIDRVPGPGPRTLSLSGSSKVGVFICYDSIYSGQIVDPKDRPEWLVTITEDAWYILPEVPLLAKTSGPYQHLAEARLRAVEEGLSVARASNPGISLVIDPYGRSWSDQLNLGEQGIVDSTIPKGTNATFYTHLGGVNLYLLFSVILVIIVMVCRRNARL